MDSFFCYPKFELHEMKVVMCSCQDTDLFKFVWRSGVTYHERANKIHVQDYLLGLGKNY